MMMLRLFVVFLALSGSLFSQNLISWSGQQHIKIKIKSHPFPDGPEKFPRYVNYIDRWKETILFEIIGNVEIDGLVNDVCGKKFDENWSVSGWLIKPKIKKSTINGNVVINIKKFNRLDGEIYLIKLDKDVAVVSSVRLTPSRLAIVYQSIKRAHAFWKPSPIECLGNRIHTDIENAGTINTIKDAFGALDKVISKEDQQLLVGDINNNRQKWGALCDELINEFGFRDGSPLGIQFENRGFMIPIEMATRLLYAYRSHLLGSDIDPFDPKILPSEVMPLPPPIVPKHSIMKTRPS